MPEENIDLTEAIQQLLKPFWEKVKNKETLDEFVQAFFVGGGQVNLQLPEFLKERLGIEDPKEEKNETYGEGTHFVVSP